MNNMVNWMVIACTLWTFNRDNPLAGEMTFWWICFRRNKRTRKLRFFLLCLPAKAICSFLIGLSVLLLPLLFWCFCVKCFRLYADKLFKLVFVYRLRETSFLSCVGLPLMEIVIPLVQRRGKPCTPRITRCWGSLWATDLPFNSLIKIK